jgi:septum formation protein
MALWLADQPLVLASKSAARRALLESAGIPVVVCAADIDERAIEARSPATTAQDVALLLARAKAGAVADKLSGRVVLGADQVLASDAARFSKPADRAAARDQLRALRGRTHALHSAVAVVRGTEVLFAHISSANLTMRPFSDAFLEAYLDTAGCAVTASVGAYQVEGLGVHLFERIDGDHATILGLPIMPLLAFLRREGFLAK